MMTLTATKNFSDILKALLDNSPALQLIKALNITPGPNSVSFSFQTRFPSSAVIEIFTYTTGAHDKDITPQNLVSSNQLQLTGVARNRNHNSRLPQPANWTPPSFPGFDNPLIAPLKQDTHYWFRITADTPYSSVAPAVTFGHFWTGKRDVFVTIPELIVYRYGSNDVGNDVDNAINSVGGLFGATPNKDYNLDLHVGLYDQVRGLVDSTMKFFTSTNNNDDLELPFPNVALQCPGAHDFLWMFANGIGNHGAWDVGPFGAPYEFPPAPNYPQHGDYNGPWADAAAVSSRLADTPAELQSPITVVLDSGNWGTHYEVVAWINTSLTAPRHAPVIFVSPLSHVSAGLTNQSVERLTGQTKKKLSASGEGALALGSPNKVHVLVPGAGRTIWSQTRDLTGKTRQLTNSWNKLAEGISAPIVVFEDDKGSMDLVGCGANGHAWHAHWDGSAAPIKGHDLGHAMNEEVALLRKGKLVDIFLLNDNGEVMHAHLAEEGKKPTWKSLGGNIGSELTAIPLHTDEIALFGLGKDGDIWHNKLASNGKSNWSSLGNSANVQLSILADGKEHIVLFAINKDRHVSRKEWNGKAWSPADTKWTELGNLDLLFGPPNEKK